MNNIVYRMYVFQNDGKVTDIPKTMTKDQLIMAYQIFTSLPTFKDCAFIDHAQKFVNYYTFDDDDDEEDQQDTASWFLSCKSRRE